MSPPCVGSLMPHGQTFQTTLFLSSPGVGHPGDAPLVALRDHLCWGSPQYWASQVGSGKEYACNAGDLGSIPGLGRSPGGRHGNPLQYSCLENPMDRGAWWAAVHGVAKSQTRLINWSTDQPRSQPCLPYFCLLLWASLSTHRSFARCGCYCSQSEDVDIAAQRDLVTCSRSHSR